MVHIDAVEPTVFFVRRGESLRQLIRLSLGRATQAISKAASSSWAKGSPSRSRWGTYPLARRRLTSTCPTFARLCP